ncbi:MAG TPA: carboxypeptidase-like regulatory domain-containing protein [Bryobacteraceae bacterium]|nr:carboxypeptidase-like regulatory domain-containing protein [Bryobacteraceae bacterium]
MRKPITCIWLIGLFLGCGLSGQERTSKDDGISTRSVNGVVNDAAGQPVAKAVVQLKDTKSLQIRSFITNPDGSYHFAGLSPNVEYQLKAEYEGSFSGKKTLSVFNSKKSVKINLKLKRSTHSPPAPSP